MPDDARSPEAHRGGMAATLTTAPVAEPLADTPRGPDTTDAVVVDALTKRFGDRTAVDHVSFSVPVGTVAGLIGPNGAGKTTLIHQISGLLPPASGEIRLDGRDITQTSPHERVRRGLARSFQITSILPGFSVLENVALAVQARSGSSFRFFGNVSGEKRLNGPAMDCLDRVALVHRAAVTAGLLSHGEKRQLELAIALAMQPKLLLLDEPMAGTGRDETTRLVGVLERLKGRFSVVLVEHDMTAVFALADRISVLIYGRIIATGAPAEVRTDPRVVSAYLGDEME